MLNSSGACVQDCNDSELTNSSLAATLAPAQQHTECTFLSIEEQILLGNAKFWLEGVIQVTIFRSVSCPDLNICHDCSWVLPCWEWSLIWSPSMFSPGRSLSTPSIRKGLISFQNKFWQYFYLKKLQHPFPFTIPAEKKVHLISCWLPSQCLTCSIFYWPSWIHSVRQ